MREIIRATAEFSTQDHPVFGARSPEDDEPLSVAGSISEGARPTCIRSAPASSIVELAMGCRNPRHRSCSFLPRSRTPPTRHVRLQSNAAAPKVLQFGVRGLKHLP